jgi:hypothetical protein
LLDKLIVESNNVWALSLQHNQINKYQKLGEEQARKNYIATNTKFEETVFHRTVKISSDFSVNGKGLPQMMSWICFIYPYLPDDSTLNFGYKKGDCSIAYLSEIRQAIEALNRLGRDDKLIKVAFPLMWRDKHEILTEYARRKIPTNCYWTCEFPLHRGTKIIPCRKCDKCMEIIVAIETLKLTDRKLYMELQRYWEV